MLDSRDPHDASSPLVISTWTMEKCADIKRSLTTRVNNARRSTPLSHRELDQMARLYCSVQLLDIELRSEQGAVMPGSLPEWVLHVRHAR